MHVMHSVGSTRLNRASVLLAATALVLCASPAFGQLEITWYTIDDGGTTTAAGGDLELNGTVGQHDAGVLVGGDLDLYGGFWPGGEFCFGDLDGDGEVGLSDLAQLLANYSTGFGAMYEDGDMDGDGDVDLSDLAALLSEYGTVCP